MDSCYVCNRGLKNPESVRLGMGPVCARKNTADTLNLPRPETPDQLCDLPFDGDIVCKRDEHGTHFNIPQRKVLHSPTGMAWGYGGSGPADFALNILLQFTDEKTAEALHQSFKWKFIASLPHEGGTIKGEDIKAFLAEATI